VAYERTRSSDLPELPQLNLSELSRADAISGGAGRGVLTARRTTAVAGRPSPSPATQSHPPPLTGLYLGDVRLGPADGTSRLGLIQARLLAGLPQTLDEPPVAGGVE